MGGQAIAALLLFLTAGIAGVIEGVRTRRVVPVLVALVAAGLAIETYH
jgi:hypothetical protein